MSTSVDSGQFPGHTKPEVSEDLMRHGHLVEKGQLFVDPHTAVVYSIERPSPSRTTFDFKPLATLTSSSGSASVPSRADPEHFVKNIVRLSGELELGAIHHLPDGDAVVADSRVFYRDGSIVVSVPIQSLRDVFPEGTSTLSTLVDNTLRGSEIPDGAEVFLPQGDKRPSTPPSSRILDGEDPSIKTRYVQTGAFSRFTFQSRVIREWVESHLEPGDRVLNACAGVWELNHDGGVVRNDLREQVVLKRDRTINGIRYSKGEMVNTNTGINVDAAELAAHFPKSSFDAVVFDPPWSLYQSNLRYEGNHVAKDGEVPTSIDLDSLPFDTPSANEKSQLGHARLAKDGFSYLLKPGGKFIQLTFSGTAMPSRLNFTRKERVIFDPLGEGKCVVGSVDQLLQQSLSSFV